MTWIHSPPPFLRDLLENYGADSLSYSCLQPDLNYYGSETQGIIAFRRRLGVTVALGNPLCASRDRAGLLAEFVSRFGRVIFAQVTGETAKDLRGLHLCATPMGVECNIELQHYDLVGRTKRDLRHYRNRARASAVVVVEEADTVEVRRDFSAITKAWITRKTVHSREIEFLIRPLSHEPERGTRLFVGRVDSQIVGFVIFDPIYRAGRLIGYAATIVRAYPGVPKGTLDFITLEAMDRFLSEDLQRLSLGVSPMYKMGESAQEHGRGALPLFFLCRRLYHQRWQPIMNIRGLSFHKSRYRAHEKPIFVATTGSVGLWEMTALLRACRIV